MEERGIENLISFYKEKMLRIMANFCQKFKIQFEIKKKLTSFEDKVPLAFSPFLSIKYMG